MPYITLLKAGCALYAAKAKVPKRGIVSREFDFYKLILISIMITIRISSFPINILAMQLK